MEIFKPSYVNNEKLIELVREQQFLYDKRCTKYKLFKHKDKAWEEIGAQLGATAKECKVRWRTLRDRFRKEKMADECPSGSGKKVGSAWKYKESMSFLDDSSEPDVTPGNVYEISIWDENESQSSATTANTSKRKHEDLFADVLLTIKKKYESSSTSKYAPFVAMVCQKFDRLPETAIDDLQVDILKLINARINQNRK